MSNIKANTGAGGYQLKSELARICLPAPRAHDHRNLAWTNSICLLFLVVGLVGFRPSPPPPPVVKPLAEPAPVIIEAMPSPPAALQPTPDEKPADEDKSVAPRVVVVTPESPAIKFAVPKVGNLVVPNVVAVAPPAAALRQTAVPRRESAQPSPSLLENTGEGGDRPKLPYPKLALELGQQGTVELLLTADEAGVMISVDVKESSSSSILDHAAADFIKRHWTVSPGVRGRLFQTKIVYSLTHK